MEKTFILVSALLVLFGGAVSCASEKDALKPTGASAQKSALCVKGAAFSESVYFLENIGLSPEDFESYPDDLKCFTENAALCEHFAGEEAYDQKRQAEILYSLEKYCSEAQMLSSVLKKKYAADAAFSKILTACDMEMSTACSSFKK